MLLDTAPAESGVNPLNEVGVVSYAVLTLSVPLPVPLTSITESLRGSSLKKVAVALVTVADRVRALPVFTSVAA